MAARFQSQATRPRIAGSSGMGGRWIALSQSNARHDASLQHDAMGEVSEPAHCGNGGGAASERRPRLISLALAAVVLLAIARAAAAVEVAPSDGDWPMAARNYASTRYSELNEVTADNAHRLRVAFTFSLGVERGQEAAPIVAGGTMYLAAPFPNVLYALDLTQPGAPLKWSYRPNANRAAQGVACCDYVNRGAVLWKDKIIYNTLDGVTIALDTRTGKELWKTPLANIQIGETVTMAPLVVKGKVLVGNAGGEFGVRGWMAALDADDGHIVWKAFHTGPDKDVLIGPEFKPFYDSDKGSDLGIKSWPPEAWRTGGGTAWGWISYDPELNLIFYGTGNPGPWNAEQRPGDNKWTGGLFARNPDTGQARWFYQFSPHDLFDYDSINENVLLDLTINGAPRKVLARPERNGYLYLIDRASGEVLSADAFFPVNSENGIDLKSGRPNYNPDKHPQVGKTVRNICPTASGAKDWNPSAYSPDTGWLYIPRQNLCMDWQATEVNYIQGTPFVGADVNMFAGPGGYRGAFIAWDPVARKSVWEIHEDLPIWSGALATAGNLVFYGTMDGWLKALDAKDGSLKWQFQTGSGIIGQPIAYRGPDGHEYIAVLSGVGGWAGAIVVANLDARDKTAAKGMVNATADLKEKTRPGGTLYVFALPAS